MRILFLTQILPYPLDAGPKIRAYYVLRFLVSAGHTVTLLSFTRSTDRQQDVRHLEGFCDSVHTLPMHRSTWKDGYHLIRSSIRGLPFLVSRDWVPGMTTKIERLIADHGPFGAVHADQLWMAPYALTARCHSDSLLVMDQHNAVFQIPDRLSVQENNPVKRILLKKEATKLFNFERRICNQFDRLVWVSDEDRKALDKDDTIRTRQQTIPICLDPQKQIHPHRSYAAKRVTFVGGLHWPPNEQGIRWFVNEVWPTVQRIVPEAVLTIIGKNPPGDLRRLSNSRVEVTGFAEDLTSYLEETAVFIVPLLAGGGMRVKILDAWNKGLPVVSTRIGAEGIAIENGKNALLADGPREFAAAVIRIFREWWLADRLARFGRETIETKYNWRKTYQAWDQVYSELPSPQLVNDQRQQHLVQQP